MITIKIVCPYCKEVNYCADDGLSIYPSTCQRCHKKLPVPKEGEQIIAEYNYE